MTRITYDGKEMILADKFEDVVMARAYGVKGGLTLDSVVINDRTCATALDGTELINEGTKRKCCLLPELITYIEDMEEIKE